MLRLTRVLALVASIGAGGAHAAIIIDGTTTGRYNSGLGDLAALDGTPGGFLLGPNVSEGDPNLSFPADPLAGVVYPAAFGANWLAGDYTGGSWSAGAVAIPSTWAVNSETAIVYEFTLGSASDIHIDLGVDNGILVWLDGVYVFGAQAAGGADISEYDIDLAAVAAGSHRLQILREDHGGGTDYAISVNATASVPEPSSLMLLGAAFVGVAWAVRRSRVRTRANARI